MKIKMKNESYDKERKKQRNSLRKTSTKSNTIQDTKVI